RDLIEEIRNYSRMLKERIPHIEHYASRFADSIKEASSTYVVSSGITYPVAVEGALKLKEAALVHAEGMQLGELRHGPLSIIMPGFPVILIEPFEERAKQLYFRVMSELETRRARIISLDSELRTRHYSIELPHSTRYLYPLAAAVVLQLLAYYLGVAKGLPVDTPPGLAKTITT
ncbi:MAG: SIS domain-containing protein, partial [Desulfurococcaceae archaeon]